MDLIVIIICAVVFIPVAIITTGPFRIGLGLLLVLLFPGYTLLVSLIPKKYSLSGLERLGLAISLSIAIVIIFGFMLSIVSISIDVILVVLSIFIIVTAGFGLYRRFKIPQEERFTLPLPFKLFKKHGRAWEIVFYVVFILLLVSLVGGVNEAIASVKMNDRFTEFYVTDENGAIQTKLQMNVNEPLILTLSVINNESVSVEYDVEWENESGLEIVSNKYNEGEVFLLNSGEKWEEEVILLPTEIGTDKRITFFLDTSDTKRYRMLSLLGDVTE